MSIRYVAAVLDNLPELGATEALVLLALADYTSDDTRECWPSVATVARRARCDRRTAQRKLKALEARGLIDRALGGFQYGKNQATRYRLKFDHDGQIVPDVEPVTELSTPGRQPASPGAAADPQGGGNTSARGRHGAAPSVIRTVIEPRGAKRATTKKDPRELTDEELEERARSGNMTAAEERERELRRRMASSKRRRP